jgi:hypothetical protein
VQNFLDCVKSRKQPVLHPELAHQVSTVAHLGNLAYRAGGRVTWDAAAERIPGNPEADRLVGVEYRAPWKLDYRRRT